MIGVAISATLLMMLGAIIGKVVTAQMIDQMKQGVRDAKAKQSQARVRLATASAQRQVAQKNMRTLAN